MSTLSAPLREQDYVEALRRQAHHLEASTRLRHSCTELWPILSNTDMLNQQLGLNPTVNDFRPDPAGGSQMYVETKAAGMTMAYEEFPFAWQEPHYLAVDRVYHKGLLKFLRFEIRAEETDEGSRVTFALDYVPAVPDLMVRGILQHNLKQMIKVMESFEQRLNQGARGLQVYFDPSPRLEDKISRLQQDWRKLAPDSPLPALLADYLLRAPDRYAGRIRPFELATLYDLPPLDTLRFCLLAARAGFLHMRWDMRCPSCKGPKENSEHLSGVSNHAFCPSCVVDYAVGFDQNLELTFFPDPGWRKVEESHFCTGGP
ncbi:MAG: DUF5939 domain-containing protein, partial [Candidatus Sericytochromatia bacterium]